MADGRRSNSDVDYLQLHNLSSVVLYKTPKLKTRKVYPKPFTVERIIHRRKVKKDYEYLVKWAGYPIEQSTWEPEEHLNSHLLSIYTKPLKPSLCRLEDASRHFYSGVLSMLKSVSVASTYIHMDLDIWRYVSQGKGVDSNHKGYKLYQIEDLCRLPLPSNWWYYLNDHGEGQAIQPPIKVRPVLSLTPSTNSLIEGKLVKFQRMPQEKLFVDILRRACNINNLSSFSELS